MSKDLVVIGLIALAGILIGGVYTTWKTAKGMAILLSLFALMAGGGALAWHLSS
ncbi:hypothetical protein [Actinokineospora xionganensis]|uniref:Uncharacterized protein n=1 Tax=Actinokineospora xionganensis TaxID=2684470 RepID=A0ABR7L4Y7_9PSEU|nr:hypothetical protein [Actinokineospora xionganensis]MBC6447752.1 hypothetical protein [Actinokineospora xionganensis]